MVSEPAQVRRHIGYVGQGNGAGHTQRVRDELNTQGVIYGLDRRGPRQRGGELLEVPDLTKLAGRKVSELSGGHRQRLDVTMGLVHAPSLLFLDEPSTGLDAHNRANLWDHIRRMRAAHDMTIVLTTHYMDEADSMAERVVIVDCGEVIADSARVEARVGDGPGAVPELLRAAGDASVRVATAQVHRPTLDDVFLTLTGRSLREPENTAGAGLRLPAGPPLPAGRSMSTLTVAAPSLTATPAASRPGARGLLRDPSRRAGRPGDAGAVRRRAHRRYPGHGAQRRLTS